MRIAGLRGNAEIFKLWDHGAPNWLDGFISNLECGFVEMSHIACPI